MNRSAPINLYAPYEPAPQCSHETSTVVWKQYETDRRVLRECDSCGKHMGWIKKADPLCASAVPYRGIQDNRWRIERETREADRQAKSDSWWATYNAYLLTAEWAARRSKVIARENGLCQGCRDAPWKHVHHLTYDRVGRELLTDLALLCLACHETAHDDGTP